MALPGFVCGLVEGRVYCERRSGFETEHFAWSEVQRVGSLGFDNQKSSSEISELPQMLRYQEKFCRRECFRERDGLLSSEAGRVYDIQLVDFLQSSEWTVEFFYELCCTSTSDLCPLFVLKINDDKRGIGTHVPKPVGTTDVLEAFEVLKVGVIRCAIMWQCGPVLHQLGTSKGYISKPRTGLWTLPNPKWLRCGNPTQNT